MSAPPTVSVVMPVYNAKRYVAETVASVLAQTSGDFEFVIVDDGSTDGTDALLRRLAARDPRIRLNRRPNTGISGALNDGIAMARGEFVARMDADDLMLPERLARQIEFLRGHPDCVAVGAQVEVIDPYGAPVERLAHKLTHEEIEAELLTGCGFAMVHPVVTMRREAVVRAGGYRSQYDTQEDLDVFLRLAEVGRLANLPECLLKYRQHYESINHTKFEKQRALKRVLMEETYRRRGLPVPAEFGFVRKPPVPRYEQTCRWGWIALKQRNLYAARRHGRDAVRLQPLRRDSWRLLLCAVRGH